MTNNKLNKEDKEAELKKYRDLVIATIDYLLDNNMLKINSENFDSDKHYAMLKTQTEEHFQKGRLTKLKQWFRDLTESQIECVNFKFNKFLKNKTGYDIDLFKSYFDRIEKVIQKGKILTDNQFYEINAMVDQLCQADHIDKNKTEILNKLLVEYEQRKSRKTKKPTA
jgi:hypothetical protein